MHCPSFLRTKEVTMVTVTVHIDNCTRCRHIDHSGAFTPGGAKQICGHTNITRVIKEVKPHLRQDDPNDPKTDHGKQYYHWRHRVIKDPEHKIPHWCPLKRGYRY